MKKSVFCIAIAVAVVLCISCENPFLATRKEYKGFITSTLSPELDKLNPPITAWPTAADIDTYGAALSTSTLSGGAANVPGWFEWDDETIIPNHGTNGYRVWFIPADEENYNRIPFDIYVTVNNQANPVVNWPTDLTASFGQTLADVSLPGNGTADIPGTFAWVADLTTPVGDVGLQQHSMTFTPNDTTNYNMPPSENVTITVTSVTIGPITWPTDLSATYGETLGDVSLASYTNGGTGTFTWNEPLATPVGDVGLRQHNMKFTPASTNYGVETQNVDIIVIKATPVVTTPPTAASITYGAALSTSTLTGGIPPVPGSFAWTDGTTIPPAGTNSYQVTFTPGDTTNYNTVPVMVSVTVYPANLTVTWPTGLTAIYGQTLSQISLAGYTNGNTGTFAWDEAPTTPVGNVGSQPHSMTFTPNDTNYGTRTQNVNITVNKATPSPNWPTGLTAVVGQTLADVSLLSYTNDPPGPAGTFSWADPITTPVGAVGIRQHNMRFTPTDTANYDSPTYGVNITVVDKTIPTVTVWPTASAITYGAALSTSTLSGGNADVPGSFAWTNGSTIPDVVNSGYEVTFTPTDTVTYTTLTGTVGITVNKATPTVTQWPTASDITYGAALSTSTLTPSTASVPGNANVPGSFAWTNSATIPEVINSGYPVTFTPTDTANYNTVPGTVSITVNKATPVVTTWPTASAITYGATLSSSTLSGGSAPVSGTFAWTNGSTVPTVVNSGYEVTFTPTNANYGTATGTVAITVNKANPTVTWPTGLTAVVGQTLADVSLGGYTNPSPNPAGTFSWADPLSTPVGAVGTRQHNMSFTPDDTANYEDYVTSAVSITVVDKTLPTVTVWPTASAITYGAALSTSTLSGGNADVPGTFAWTTGSTIPDVVNSGYSVTFTPTNTALYSTLTGTVGITVNKATPTVTVWPTASAITYGAALSTSTLTPSTASVPGNANVPGSFAWTNSATIPEVINSGYPVTFTPTNVANYNTVEQNVAITVNKATPTVTTWPTASAITYGATLSSSTLSGGIPPVSGTFAWTNGSTVPTVVNSGYEVTFTPTDANYGTATGTVPITVNKANPTVTWPTGLTAVVGQTLADVSLGSYTNPSPNPAGTFSWADPLTTLVGAVGTQQHNMRFTPDDTANYNSPTSGVNITVVDKTLPTVTVWPTASDITYGAALSTSTLSGGNADVPGSFAWTNGSTIPTVVNGGYSVTFTPTDTVLYSTRTGTVAITVHKATPTVTVWPTASAITYGAALSTSTLTPSTANVPGNANVPGSFAWTNGSTVPTVVNSGYPVTFTPTDTANYNTVPGTVSITVNQATPEVTTWPTGATITYPATLSTSALSGGSADVPGTFAWTNGSTIPIVANTGYSVTFTPDDNVTYTTRMGTGSITVNKGTPEVTTWPTASAVTYGATLSTSTLSGGNANVPGSFAWTNGSTVPTVVNSGYSVTFTPTDTNYNTVSGTVSITVNQDTPVVTTWPTASTITYPAALSTSTLSGGSAPVSGTFAWTNGSTIPTVTNSGYEVTFTPTDTNYNTATQNVPITVNKGTPEVTTWPTASAVTYPAALSTSTLSGGNANVPGSFAWTNGSTVPTVGNSGYPVRFTPTDVANYNTVEQNVAITVNKADPTVTTWPTASAITYGATLSTSTLSGGSAPVSGTFAWTTPTTTPPVGTNGYPVTFTPDDTVNYETATQNVAITVNKADPTVTTWPTASAITYGAALSTSALTGGIPPVPGSFAWTNSATIPEVINSGYPVTFTPTDTANYNTATQNVAITVNKVTPVVTTWPTASAVTYGAALSTSTLSGGIPPVPGSFAWTTGSTIPTVTNTGYPVTFTPSDTANYNTATQNVAITVNKANPSVTWPSNLTATYGDTLAAISLPGNGTSSPAGTFSWTADGTTSVGNAGTRSFNMTFTPSDTANYNTAAQSVNITVNKANPTVTWPAGLWAVVGHLLKDIALPGNGTGTPGTFTWTNGDWTVIQNPGSQSFNMTFTPTDTTNYNTVTNDVSIVVYAVPEMEMVTITGAVFWMGSLTTESERGPDELSHQVSFSTFQISKYEVTQIQYHATMGTQPSYFTTTNGRVPSPGEMDIRRPVEQVSWYEAIVFCNRLSMDKSLTPAYRISGSTDPAQWGTIPTSNNATWNAVEIVPGSNGYRLPTEMQWEYACRAATGTAYNTGATISNDTGWYVSNSNNMTHEVGLKPPNAWGLYDMHGNVQEWCWDWYGAYPNNTETDPTGPASGTVRVARGGGWGLDGQYLRSARRSSYQPYNRDASLGFRVVRP